MNNHICFLITILYNDGVIKCALKVDRDRIGEDVAKYPMEPENRKIIHSLLPLHVQMCGKIIDIDTSLFEVTTLI